MMITKSSGKLEPFSETKIAETAKRAGASSALVDAVVKEVRERASDGTTTKQILAMVLEIMHRASPPVAARYNLARAIFKLGPTGFEFEKYIAELLRAYGYKTELPEILTGACITHEVDVLAEKDSRRAMIECKFRHEAGIFIGVKDVLATWGRFLDLVEGASLGTCPHIDECWIMTNSRFSADALKYAHCKGMVLIGWDHPEERNLAHMIDAQAVYPVTVLHRADPQTITALAKGQVMLLQQLAGGNPADLARRTGLSEERIRALAEEAAQIMKR